MIIHKSGFILFLLFILTSRNLTSQSGFIPTFKHITVDEGLPTNVVYSVFIDHGGYLWVGTDQGAAKYDGYRFEYFTKENEYESIINLAMLICDEISTQFVI